LPSYAQQIKYSELELRSFGDFKFEIIGKYSDKILVYRGMRATYAIAPILPDESFTSSYMCIFDSEMNMVKRRVSGLPGRISGVHFLTFPQYFYMFYQYLHAHAIHCMVAKFDPEGNMIGTPKEMDRTVTRRIHFQSQIYTVISSENKKYLMAFKFEINRSTYLVTNLVI
jgi:hypothetical protein